MMSCLCSRLIQIPYLYDILYINSSTKEIIGLHVHLERKGEFFQEGCNIVFYQKNYNYEEICCSLKFICNYSHGKNY